MPCYLPKNVKWLEMEKDKESAKKKVVPMVEFEPTTCSMRAGRDNQQTTVIDARSRTKELYKGSEM